MSRKNSRPRADAPAFRPTFRSAPAPAAQSSRKETSGPWELLIAGDFNDRHVELLEAIVELPLNSSGTIYFDSNGGSVYTALSLLSLIQLRNLKATGVVLGECSSAALLPFAACRRRYVMPFSTHLFHPMKWESEENVRLEEAAEWTRHFKDVQETCERLMAEMFPLDRKLLTSWSIPGRFVSGSELAGAGVAELIEPGSDLTQVRLPTPH
ncbi:ATP-dependent Clp protease proteolytic subunit [Rubinisphaera margarita]|uniref:ATP-dependent Clp protease proteolytic subunit n=1 Tax=Rubinisphaera margarita TaxID=2909586 RepID=UPI001EE8EAC9|nr:ATP-dependent Clp protease proteolytic subunit [Rubinisphaera margarita]MCG6157378.1 ATP-dependent Clp protease proteolytic subunit [Rubinisphaera margarita]